MTDTGASAVLADMEAAFSALHDARGNKVQAHEALAVARQFPRTAAISGAIATYVIGFQTKLDQRVSAKNPTKSGLGLMLSKPIQFENHHDLANAYELAFTQTAYDREASLVAMVPYLNTSLQAHFDRGMTRYDFNLISQVAVWSAGTISENLVRDVAAIGRALNR